MDRKNSRGVNQINALGANHSERMDHTCPRICFSGDDAARRNSHQNTSVSKRSYTVLIGHKKKKLATNARLVLFGTRCPQDGALSAKKQMFVLRIRCATILHMSAYLRTKNQTDGYAEIAN